MNCIFTFFVVFVFSGGEQLGPNGFSLPKKPAYPIFFVNLVFFLFFLLLPIEGFSYSEGSGKYALIIGNYGYTFYPLKNPKKDAIDMAKMLEELGFETVMGENVDLYKMEELIDNFYTKIKNENSVSLFYYAGHAIQIEGRNYLLPVDADIKFEAQMPIGLVQLDYILEKIGHSTNINIIILDACRNSPFSENIENPSRERTRDLGRGIEIKKKKIGLAPVKGPPGVLIAFATAPDSVAADGNGDNGLFTKHILRYAKQEGLTIEQVFKKVRMSVAEESKGRQIPWERSSLLKDFYFIPSLEKSTELSMKSIFGDIELAISEGRYGVAYQLLKTAEKMAKQKQDLEKIQNLKNGIKLKLGSK